MALFRRKKEVKELKLPEADLTFPELPHASEESHELPALPTLPTLPKMPEHHPMGTLSQLEPVEKPMPTLPRMPIPVSKPMIPESRMPTMEVPKVREPIFVKIDKFRDAMSNFELIKKRINETSSFLDKVRETRAKEEAELNEWANELSSIKQKISVIDKKIFSQLG